MSYNHRVVAPAEGLINREDCYKFIKEYVFQLSKDNDTSPGYIGLEIEMLPISKDSTKILGGKPPLSKQKNIIGLLKKLAKKNSWTLEVDTLDSGEEVLTKVILPNKGGNISFEPGGQLELSPKPFPSLVQSFECLELLQKNLEELFEQEELSFVQMGINPWHDVDEIGIKIPKKRYLAMDKYFSSEAGCQMMRQTMSQQICLDSGKDAHILAKRYVAAQLIAPFAAALFCYSPIKNSKKTKLLSNRIKAWQNLDKFRTGFVGVEKILEDLNQTKCIESYLDYALKCPVIFIESLDFHIPNNHFTLEQWIMNGFNGVFPTISDFKNHLSLLFPEVRPRGYLEFRSIDAQSRVWQNIPAMFICGLIYDSNNLDHIIETLSPIAKDLHELMNEASYGLNSKKISKVALDLIDRSLIGLKGLPDSFQNKEYNKILQVFMEHFSFQKRTPANDLLDHLKNKKDSTSFSYDDIISLELKWNTLIS